MSAHTEGFWSTPPEKLLSLLQSSEQGLTTAEAGRRLPVYARNRVSPSRRSGWLWILLAQYRSPIILILVFASLFLPFLPMLPRQILLTNLMTDFPEMAIASDRVDREFVDKPHRWDIRFIRRFMVVFGLLSCLFDYVTFGALLLVFRADAEFLRTGWFVESVVSAALIVLVIRTRHSSLQSRPSPLLLLATCAIILTAVLLPRTPMGPLFAFKSLPSSFLVLLGGIIVSYVATAEAAKRLFYRKVAP